MKFDKHKSWGMVGLARTYGAERELFGSDVTNHNTIKLTIKHAQKHRELGRDWTMGDDILCEVELSALQFAELLTNMNVGDGVPCTIRYTREDGYIKYKNEKNKLEVIYEERSSVIDKASLNIQEVAAQVSELISNKKISQKIGNELLNKLEVVRSNLVGNNCEFYKQQTFNEISQMVVEAKSQISEHVNQKIYSVGLEKLMNMSDVMPMLNGSDTIDCKEDDVE